MRKRRKSKFLLSVPTGSWPDADKPESWYLRRYLNADDALAKQQWLDAAMPHQRGQDPVRDLIEDLAHELWP